MKKLSILLATLLISTMMMHSAQARDTRHKFPLSDAMGNENAKQKLDGSVRFYFGRTPHPGVVKNYGEFMSNKKTNAFNKTDKYACEWAFLTAMLSFQDRAKSLGANAVINIKSYYKKNEIISSTEYECGAGGILAGVTFKAEVVKLGGGSPQKVVMPSDTTQSLPSSASSGSSKVQTAQKLLTILGFNPGAADGVMGNKTRNAISEYQKQQGLATTGELDSVTLARMGIK